VHLAEWRRLRAAAGPPPCSCRAALLKGQSHSAGHAAAATSSPDATAAARGVIAVDTVEHTHQVLQQLQGIPAVGSRCQALHHAHQQLKQILSGLMAHQAPELDHTAQASEAMAGMTTPCTVGEGQVAAVPAA
jgi:hypothetical protein